MCIAQSGTEAESYGSQIRQMFTAAGFEPDPSAGVFGLTRNPAISMARLVGFPADETWVYGVYRTNSELSWRFEETNGFRRPIVQGNDTFTIYAALADCLNQVRVPTKWMEISKLVDAGKYEFIVPPRDF